MHGNLKCGLSAVFSFFLRKRGKKKKTPLVYINIASGSLMFLDLGH